MDARKEEREKGEKGRVRIGERETVWQEVQISFHARKKAKKIRKIRKIR